MTEGGMTDGGLLLGDGRGGVEKGEKNMKVTQAVEYHLQYCRVNSKKIPSKLSSRPVSFNASG